MLLVEFISGCRILAGQQCAMWAWCHHACAWTLHGRWFASCTCRLLRTGRRWAASAPAKVVLLSGPRLAAYVPPSGAKRRRAALRVRRGPCCGSVHCKMAPPRSVEAMWKCMPAPISAGDPRTDPAVCKPCVVILTCPRVWHACLLRATSCQVRVALPSTTCTPHCPGQAFDGCPDSTVCTRCTGVVLGAPYSQV